MAQAEYGASRKFAIYVLVVLTLVYAISFIDRQILAILAIDVRADLDIDNANLGFLYGTAFAVFYSTFGIPIGRLADNWSRVYLLALGLALWSLMTCLAGLSSTFAMLAIARIGVGIGEATCSPASVSLLSDYYPLRRRATAMSVYASGLYLGTGLSLLIGGFVSSRWNEAFEAGGAPLDLVGWQATFLAVGIPGLLLIPFILIIREPLRRTVAEAASARAAGPAFKAFGKDLLAIGPPFTLVSASRYRGGLRANLFLLAGVVAGCGTLSVLTGDRAQWAAFGTGVYAVGSWIQTLKSRDPFAFWSIWGRTPIVLMILAFGTITFMQYATLFFAPSYAIETFYGASDGSASLLGGLSASEEVGLLIGLAASVGASIGVLLGGLLADWWRSRNPAGRVYTVAASIALSTPPMLLAFSADDTVSFFVWLCLAISLNSAWSGAGVAALQDAVPPQMRASASATFLLSLTMVGLALGPYFAGKVATVTADLRLGVLSVYVALPLTLFLLWRVSKVIGRVEEEALNVSARDFLTSPTSSKTA